MDEIKKTADIKPGFPRFFLFVLLFVAFLLAYIPVFKELFYTWSTSDEYSHGFIIIPVALYILWTKREKLAVIEVETSRSGLIFLIASLILYVLAQFSGISTLSSLTLVLTIASSSLYLFGPKIFRKIIFPVFILLFMIPIPSQVYSAATIPLQLFVSKVSVFLASLLSIPVYREGNIINLPERTLQVVQACSGLRSIISLLTLSLIFGYLTLRSNLLRSILFFAGIPVAIFVNIIRVLLMVVAFYYFNFDLTTGTVHTFFGLVIFFLALVFLYIVQRIISVWEKEKGH